MQWIIFVSSKLVAETKDHTPFLEDGVAGTADGSSGFELDVLELVTEMII